MLNNHNNTFDINWAIGELIFLNRFTFYPGESKKEILMSKFYQESINIDFDIHQEGTPLFCIYTKKEKNCRYFFRLDFFQDRLTSVAIMIPNLNDEPFMSFIQHMFNEFFETEFNTLKSDDLEKCFQKQFSWGSLFLVVDSEGSFVKVIVEYILSVDPANLEKLPPLFSTTTGRLKKDVENVPNFRELARKYRREEFAKSLGYRTWDTLIIRSVCFFEYQSLNFYFSKSPSTGHVLVWVDRIFQTITEFTGWQECFKVMETAQFRALIERKMEKLHKNENQMDWGIF